MQALKLEAYLLHTKLRHNVLSEGKVLWQMAEAGGHASRLCDVIRAGSLTCQLYMLVLLAVQQGTGAYFMHTKCRSLRVVMKQRC